MSNSVSNTNSSSTTHPYENLIQLVSQWIAPLEYQVVHIEIQTHKQKILRIFIDHLENSSKKGIGIEDCVKVTRAIEELLDQSKEVAESIPGTYELEVSSPGVDRPLRTLGDFQRYTGKDVRVHVYRPLTGEEIENAKYQSKNPKQKNFLGTLEGLRGNKIILGTTRKNSDTENDKTKAKRKALLNTNSAEGSQILIPLPLISKANLEPQFDFESSDESEKTK